MNYKHIYKADGTFDIYFGNIKKPDNYAEISEKYRKALESGEVEEVPYVPPSELTVEEKNEQIRQQREARYRQEVDPLTNELYRRRAISDISQEEDDKIIAKIDTLSNGIVNDLPYIEEEEMM